MNFYSVLRPLLMRLDPESAHQLGLRLMKSFPFSSPESFIPTRTSFGNLRNPIGLAAGYDKTGEYARVLEKLGFGYVTVGTITLKPFGGNPRPRVIRYSDNKTLVNALGFPNPGAEAFVTTIIRQKLTVPLVGSLSGRTIPDIVECYRLLQPHLSAVEVNLSSPNTAKLADLRQIDVFRELARTLAATKSKPTFLKIPPFLNEGQFAEVIQLVRIWSDLGFEGVTACNARPVAEPRVAMGTGGLSGPVLFPGLLKAIRMIRNAVPLEFEVNAVGGISTAGDVREALAAGAQTVQLLTSLVYEGPSLIRRLLSELAEDVPQG